MGEAKQLISKENFTQWTKDCGVKCIQKQYDEMAIAALKNGRSLQEEMAERGFKDFHQFSKSCPRFNRYCWPIEFAELGSGYVLYFQFLAFLTLIFLTHLCLQAGHQIGKKLGRIRGVTALKGGGRTGFGKKVKNGEHTRYEVPV
ncbi:unnamed protein product [Effrenium voratum]|uniref:Transmembrane protein n=1 Tax=Effrenium voratum TaxID=2562239 RepID=A0AA36MV42_9DINO|nr:unnamed protein product [Effrenium voratum]